MQNQSKREEIIQYANSLIEKNNDKINALKEQISIITDDNVKKNILYEVENLEQDNRRLSLRLHEPVLGMILEIYRLREIRKTERDKSKKDEISSKIEELNNKIIMEQFGRDKNIGRFNKF